MAADEWRMCVDWLVRCKILPEDHRAKRDDAQAFDLAQALRDGVLLCHLLNNLKPNCIDPKDFNPRPQLSQFVCLKNIRAFLQTCEKVFRVKTQDLFEPPDLFDVKNFRKVLHTLSKLSKSEIVETSQRRNTIRLSNSLDPDQDRRSVGPDLDPNCLQRLSADNKSCHVGFPTNNHQIGEHEYYNTLEDLAQGFPPNTHRHDDSEEDIYGNLQDMALETDLSDNEELYDKVYQEEDDEIYEDLCSTRRRRTHKERESVSDLPEPKTKKDFCIKEMVDTERNYVEALQMIVQKFIKPLKNVISQQDKEIIFSQIESLLEVHTGFSVELSRTCTTLVHKIFEVFIKWKTKFLLYGDYCSNLPRAQEHIEELTRKNEVVKTSIEECERKANDGRFKLRDLLHVPMQRVLKYHLLLKELIKATDRSSDEKRNLEIALEAMQDLSLYVNEVKRDNESLLLIQEIQNSIVDLQMPQNTSLKDYGRLQKDGELKVKSHIDTRIRSRYIFLFDKVMLMAKSKEHYQCQKVWFQIRNDILLVLIWVQTVYKGNGTITEHRPTYGTMRKRTRIQTLIDTHGETYSFKEAIVLAEYKVDAASAARDGMRRPDKWNCSFQMVKIDNSMAYTFYAKTDDMKRKWIEGIKLALDNTQPAAGKNFIMTTFTEAKVCDVCGKLLRGVFFQGYTDPQSKQCVHKECIGKKPQPVPQTPPRIMETVKAKVDYTGLPSRGGGSRPLKFKEGVKIDVIEKAGDWWRGVVSGSQEEGWFPSQLVEPEKKKPKPSYEQAQVTVPGGRVMLESGSAAAGGASNKPLVELTLSPWYMGPMSRDTAAERLKIQPNGTFLVRDSENPARRGFPALSIKYSGNVRHIKIEKNSEGMFFMADTRFFHSLPELVEFYQQNELSDSFPEVNTTLVHPYKTISGHPDVSAGIAELSFTDTASNGVLHSPSSHLRSPSMPKTPTFNASGMRILSYATAVYDYAATATTQLSLTKGDRVMVLSKTGQDKGWWKGEHCETGKIGYFPYAYVREEDED